MNKRRVPSYHKKPKTAAYMRKANNAITLELNNNTIEDLSDAITANIHIIIGKIIKDYPESERFDNVIDNLQRIDNELTELLVNEGIV